MRIIPPALGAALAMLAIPAPPAAAQESIASFYAGKQIRVVVGSDAGGGYDAYARTVAAHLGKHIPGNPSFIVQNMPGVGSVIAVNHIVNVAPQDGTVIGAVNPASVTAPLFRPGSAKYDPRSFHWLGSPVTITFTIVVSKTAPVQTLDQLFTTELMVASAGGASRDLPLLANGILGTKFKIILGYKSAGSTMLAIERGEVQGNGGDALNNLKAVHAEKLRNGTLKIIASYGLRPHPELAGVPMVMDHAKTTEQRQAMLLVLRNQDMGWPYMMAGGVPAERAAAIRNAFAALMKDPEFRAEAQRRKLDLSPIAGEAIAKQVGETLATPPAIVAQVKKIMGD